MSSEQHDLLLGPFAINADAGVLIGGKYGIGLFDFSYEFRGSGFDAISDISEAVMARISAAKAMASKWGALQVTIHTTTGDQAENADRLLKRRGANLIGGYYVL